MEALDAQAAAQLWEATTRLDGPVLVAGPDLGLGEPVEVGRGRQHDDAGEGDGDEGDGDDQAGTTPTARVRARSCSASRVRSARTASAVRNVPARNAQVPMAITRRRGTSG